MVEPFLISDFVRSFSRPAFLLGLAHWVGVELANLYISFAVLEENICDGRGNCNQGRSTRTFLASTDE